MLQIGEEMAGREADVRVGESFEVRLPENPTTGYRWELQPTHGLVVEAQDNSFDRASATVGGGGVRSWRFRAVEPGVSEIRMDSRRSWEPAGAGTFRVTVRVSPA